MKKMAFLGLLLISVSSYGAKEVTVCFAKGDCSKAYSYATIGEDVKLCGGQCNGEKTIVDMYKDGWQLNSFLEGLQGSFGLIFDRDVKSKK